MRPATNRTRSSPPATTFTHPADAVHAYATGPPVYRIIYGYCTRHGTDVAVVLTGGDKTTLGNHWYPPNIAESQTRLEQYTRQHTDLTPIVKRGNR